MVTDKQLNTNTVMSDSSSTSNHESNTDGVISTSQATGYLPWENDLQMMSQFMDRKV